jgi:uncharacterized protein YpmB
MVTIIVILVIAVLFLFIDRFVYKNKQHSHEDEDEEEDSVTRQTFLLGATPSGPDINMELGDNGKMSASGVCVGKC